MLALLPGSRVNEINRNLPIMVEALSYLQVDRVVIPAANEIVKKKIEVIIGDLAVNVPIEVRLGGAREVLLESRAAVVASGTATLEAALARCPTVLVYKVSPLLAWIARRVIKGISFVGLTNIIWEKNGSIGEVPMPELLQEDFTPIKVANEIRRWLDSDQEHLNATKRLDSAVKLLNSGSSAFAKIVSIIHSS